MTKITFVIIFLLLFTNLLLSQQKKENDFDVIYSEDKVPNYELPELLKTAEGKRISSARDWNNIRRPQLLSLFAN